MQNTSLFFFIFFLFFFLRFVIRAQNERTDGFGEAPAHRPDAQTVASTQMGLPEGQYHEIDSIACAAMAPGFAVGWAAE